MGGLRLRDPWRRLRRQAELELLQEELLILLRLGVAGKDIRKNNRYDFPVRGFIA